MKENMLQTREMLRTSAYSFGFQHLPRDLANVSAWKTMFGPYIEVYRNAKKKNLKLTESDVFSFSYEWDRLFNLINCLGMIYLKESHFM